MCVHACIGGVANDEFNDGSDARSSVLLTGFECNFLLLVQFLTSFC
jgi:hypothetical protein